MGHSPDEAAWLSRARHLGGLFAWLGRVGFPPVGWRRVPFRVWCVMGRVHRWAWFAGWLR